MPSLAHPSQSVRVRAVSVPQVWKQASTMKHQVSVSVSWAEVGFQALNSSFAFSTFIFASPLPVDEFLDSGSWKSHETLCELS